ncbi:GNAT family N-acetyltransferase [bacterium]|nr:GNAT family N-acetyltransferase [bacterium]
MKVELYTQDRYDDWENFVLQANNGTIFHLRRFLSYHPPGRFDELGLIFRQRGKIIGLLPAVIEGDTVVSHRGASYGGFVVANGVGIYNSYRMVDSALEFLLKEGFSRLVLTQTPQIYYLFPHNHIDFVLAKRGFVFLKRELTAVLKLERNIDDNFARFKPEARTAVRKAEREGAQVRLSSDWKQFYRILEKNLGMRHQVKPTHTLDELLCLYQLFPEKVLLFGNYYRNELIAGVVVFVANPRVILAFYISHNEDFQHLRPVNLLFYRIIGWGIEHGFQYLDFGTYTLNMDPNFGLARFKEGFGATGLFRDTYTGKLAGSRDI